MFTNKAKISKLIDHPQQMIIGHMALKAETVKQTILTQLALAHHIQNSMPTTQSESETVRTCKQRVFQHYPPIEEVWRSFKSSSKRIGQALGPRTHII